MASSATGNNSAILFFSFDLSERSTLTNETHKQTDRLNTKGNCHLSISSSSAASFGEQVKDQHLVSDGGSICIGEPLPLRWTSLRFERAVHKCSCLPLSLRSYTNRVLITCQLANKRQRVIARASSNWTNCWQRIFSDRASIVLSQMAKWTADL